MIRIGLLVIGIGCVLGSAVCGYLVWSAQPPGFVCNNPVHDFGNLNQGQVVQAEFTLINQYDRPVEIKGVKKSCGCSDISCSAKSVQPGEQVTLRAKWTIGTLRGSSSVRIWILYTLEDGTGDHVELRMEGKIIPDIEFAPDYLDFVVDQDDAHVVALSPGRLQEVQIRRVYCTHRAFTATLMPAEKVVSVVFASREWNQEPGTAEIHLVVQTNSAIEPVIYIPLRVHSAKDQSAVR